MKKSKQLAIKKNYFSPVVWDQMGKMATTFIQSHAMPSTIQNAAQAIVVMQTGFEMGMKPMEAIKSLYIVNGQVNVYGAATIRRLREHGYSVSYEMKTDGGGSCVATVTKGKEKYTETYSFDNAEKSGYTKDSKGCLKVGWRLGINRMMKLRYGAVSMIIKSYLPEVMGSANDIVEVAEDYPEIKEEKTVIVDNQPKTIITPPEKKEENIQAFIDKNRKDTVIVEPKEVKGGKDGQ